MCVNCEITKILNEIEMSNDVREQLESRIAMLHAVAIKSNEIVIKGIEGEGIEADEIAEAYQIGRLAFSDEPGASAKRTASVTKAIEFAKKKALVKMMSALFGQKH